MASTRGLSIEEIAVSEDRQIRAEAIRRRKARTVMVMGAVFALLIAGVAFVGYNINDMRSSSGVKSAYESAYTSYLASIEQLDESLISVSGVLVECRNSVEDVSVCANLERLNAQGLELSNVRVYKIDIHAKRNSEIKKEIKVLREKQSLVDQTRQALLEALAPIAQSQVDKVKASLDSAVTDAENTIAQAQKIMNEVGEEVQDPAVHGQAQAAVEALRAQLEGVKAVSGTDTAAYIAALNSLKQATEALRTATNTVSYSHQLWEQEQQEQQEAEGESARDDEGHGGDRPHGDRERRRQHNDNG